MTRDIFDCHFTTNLFGLGLRACVTDSHIWRSIANTEDRSFENKVGDYIESHLKPGWMFVDVGAHCGVFSVLADYILRGDGEIVAFEPNDITFEVLKFNLSSLITISYAEKKAIAEDKKTAILYNSPDNDGDNRLSPVEGYEPQECQTQRLDDSFYLRTWDGPIFLKIDTQWEEIPVLRSASRLGNVAAGVVEVQIETRDEVRRILEGQGFTVDDLGPDYGFHT